MKIIAAAGYALEKERTPATRIGVSNAFLFVSRQDFLSLPEGAGGIYFFAADVKSAPASHLKEAHDKKLLIRREDFLLAHG